MILSKLHYVLPFYLGKNVMYPNGEIIQLDAQLLHHIVKNELEVKVIVRELQHMPYTDALKVCKWVDDGIFGDYRYSEWVVEKDSSWSDYWKAYRVINEKVDEWFQVDLIDGTISIYNKKNSMMPRPLRTNQWEFYLAAGYDLPFSPDHKTLVDSGIGISFRDDGQYDYNYKPPPKKIFSTSVKQILGSNKFKLPH